MLILATLIGLGLGWVLGLTGAGGAIFALPLFVLVLGMETQSAIALSLAAVALGAFVGALRRRRDIIWAPAIGFAVLGILFAPFGRVVSELSPEWLVTVLFAVVTLVIARRMWLRAERGDREREADSLCVMTSPTRVQLQPRCMGALGATGSITGFLSGLLGVGGGFLITPVLLRLTPARLQQVVATSLLVIAAAAVSGALFSIERLLALPPVQTAPVLGGIVIGVLLGAHFADRIDPVKVQRGFALLALLAAVSILVPLVLPG